MGLTFTMPLGSSQKKSIQKERASLRQNFDAKLIDIENSIVNSHNTIKSSLKNLKTHEVYVNSSINQLEKRLKSQRKKFDVGRVDLFDLVLEEERITSLKNRKIILLHTNVFNVLNYSSIFDKWKCSPFSDDLGGL